MEELTTYRRVARTIRECRALGIEPDARTVAEIMIDDDVTAHKYGELSSERAFALVEYEDAAARVLTKRSTSQNDLSSGGRISHSRADRKR
jgi:hypothetical protein